MTNDLLLKFVKHTATPSEVRDVHLWISKSPANEKRFQVMQTMWAANEIVYAMQHENPDEQAIKKICEALPGHIKQKKVKQYVLISVSFAASIAASLILFFSLNTSIKPSYDYQAITTNKKSSDVLLKSTTGAVYIFSDSATTISYDKIGDARVNNDTIKNVLVKQEKQDDLNTIWTPYGKRSKILLADGTLVHLNSGSTFMYPSTFDGASKREVYLEGEAYFEVSKEKDRKFIVQTKYKVIEVLGTKFNVLVDLDERYFETVLVEGSVSVNTNKGNKILNPAQSYSIIDNKIEEIKSVKTSIYTAWIDGKLKFHDHSFSDVIQQIERIYNIEVRDIDTQYLNLKITGYLNIKPTAEETIKILMQTFLEGRIDLENKFNIIHK